MTQRLESIKACKCEQCGEWFYYKRKTAIYCSSTCRKQAHRGSEASDKYKYDLHNEYERLAAVIAETHPRAFKQLESIKNNIGNHAVIATLQVIQTLELWKS